MQCGEGQHLRGEHWHGLSPGTPTKSVTAGQDAALRKTQLEATQVPVKCGHLEDY